MDPLFSLYDYYFPERVAECGRTGRSGSGLPCRYWLMIATGSTARKLLEVRRLHRLIASHAKGLKELYIASTFPICKSRMTDRTRYSYQEKY